MSGFQRISRAEENSLKARNLQYNAATARDLDDLAQSTKIAWFEEQRKKLVRAKVGTGKFANVSG